MQKTFSQIIVRLALVAVILSVPLGLGASAALADTVPPAGTPATVSADPLPTVQIDGIVWAEAISGNTVYATGQFSNARPAGAGAGTNLTARSNLLAFDIRTGNLIPTFNHSLNGPGRAISVSPDGKKLYVGGKFSQADGQARSNLAAFDLTSNTLAPGFADGPNDMVKAVAATNGGAFVGGNFTKTVSGQVRKGLAAYTSGGALNTTWKPSATFSAGGSIMVWSLLALSDKVVIGGSFDQLSGKTYYGSGAVSRSTGADLPWKSQSSTYPIRMFTLDGAITSLSTDGTNIYMTGFVYRNQGTLQLGGTFEGRAAVSPKDGSLIWVNGCYGDSYDAIPIGNVLYSVTHAHDCSAIGTFPDGASRRALAETTNATGKNGPPSSSEYGDFQGLPDSTQLDWYPVLNTGNVSGSAQAAWSITGNATYIALGGEFTKAQGVAQQGLVRYGIKSVAPNKIGPTAYPSVAALSGPADAQGRAKVTVRTTSDEDSAVLRYTLYRDGVTKALYTTTIDTRSWKTPTFTYTDTGLKPGTAATYRVVVNDSFKNTLTGYSPVDDTSSAITYSGTWTNSQNRGRGDYANGVHYTTTNGNSASYTFSGNAITLMTDESTLRGKLSISIDGGAATTVDAYNTKEAHQVKIFTKTGLANTTHTIKVTKLSGSFMVIDGFIFQK